MSRIQTAAQGRRLAGDGMTAISQMRDGRGECLGRAKLMWQVDTVRHHDVVVLDSSPTIVVPGQERVNNHAHPLNQRKRLNKRALFFFD